MEHRFDFWTNDTSTSVLDEKHKKTIYRTLLLPPTTIYQSFRGNFVEAKICFSGAVKSMEDMPWHKIRRMQSPIFPWPTSSCPQMATTSRTATIKNRYPCYTEILWNGNFFFFSEFLISSYVSRWSNKDAKDLQEFNIFSNLLRKSKINTKFVLRSES